MAGEEELWWEGERFSGRRRLDAAELESLRGRIARDRARHRWGARVGRAGLALAATGLAVCVCAALFLSGDRSGEMAAALGAMIFLPALLGALQEVAAGYNRASRALFAAFLAGAALGATVVPEAARDAVLMVSMLGLVFGGWAMLLVRWSDGGRVSALLDSATEDAREGEVLRFGADTEVLPSSRALYRAGGRVVDEWLALELFRVAPTPGGDKVPLAPWSERGAEPETAAALQRHMTQEERSELARHINRALRNALLSFPITLYASLFLLRLGENLLLRKLRPELSAWGWAAGLSIAGWFLLKGLRFWLALKADLAEDKVVVVPPLPPRPAAEVLPLSGVLWSADGAPAPWRSSRF